MEALAGDEPRVQLRLEAVEQLPGQLLGVAGAAGAVEETRPLLLVEDGDGGWRVAVGQGGVSARHRRAHGRRHCGKRKGPVRCAPALFG